MSTREVASTRPTAAAWTIAARAAGAGAVVYVLALVVGELWLGSDSAGDDSSQSVGAWAITLAIAAAGGALAVWLGGRALSGDPSRLAKYTLGLGVAAVLTVIAFWAGWSSIFGAVAVALGLTYRRRVGALSALAGTGLALGALGFLASAVFCMIG